MTDVREMVLTIAREMGTVSSVLDRTPDAKDYKQQKAMLDKWRSGLLDAADQLTLLSSQQLPAPGRGNEFDNHHNAVTCPYCNPLGLKFESPIVRPNDAKEPRQEEPRAASAQLRNEIERRIAAGIRLDLPTGKITASILELIASEAKRADQHDGLVGRSGREAELETAEAIENERELCAMVAATYKDGFGYWSGIQVRIAEKIRARAALQEPKIEEARGRSPQLSTWQDIRTAPTDGTWVLGYDPNAGIESSIAMMWFHSDPEVNAWLWVEDGCEAPATHWMPLPAPPASDAKRATLDDVPSGDSRQNATTHTMPALPAPPEAP